MDKITAQEIIAGTRENYEAMAEQFSQSRSYLPADLTALQEYIVKGEKILDLGCGNGRFAELFAGEDYIGADISEALLHIARSRQPDKTFLLCQPLALPFADSSFDGVFCLAVLHHLPSREMRGKFLEEIRRVLKPGGRLVLTCWYLVGESKYLPALLKLALLKLLGKNPLDFGDLFLPFRDGKGHTLARRYFHAFTRAGLGGLVARRGFVVESAGLVPRGRHKNLQIVARAPD
jgi:SAM-dependent methyltransferase